MADVREFRVAITVDDFDDAVAFYRDSLGFDQLADWTTDDGRVVLLDVGRATLEILDEAQAAFIDRVEAGERVSGVVRFAVEVDDIDAAAAGLVEAGAVRQAPTVVTPWGDRNARLCTPGDLQLTLFTEAGASAE